MSDPSFWRSGHGQVTVPVNCYLTSVILCPDKNGYISILPSAPIPPSSGPTERKRCSAGSTLRARYSDSAQLSSLRPGAQPNWPGFSGCSYGGWWWMGAGREQVPQKTSQAEGCCHKVAEVGMGELTLPQGLGLASGWP